MNVPALIYCAVICLHTYGIVEANECEQSNNAFLRDSYTAHSSSGKVICIPNWEEMMFDVGEPNELPHPFYAPYLDSGSWPWESSLDIPAMLNAGVKNMIVAFVQDHLPDAPTNQVKPAFAQLYGMMHGPGLNSGNLAQAFKNARSVGGEYMLSFGGADGVYLAASITDTDLLADMFYAILRIYKSRYVDFDIEGAYLSDINAITRTADAMKLVIQRYNQEGLNLDIVLTLPAIPSGLAPSGVQAVNIFIDAGAKPFVVNMMTMFFPPAPPTGMASQIISSMRGLACDSNADNTTISNSMYSVVGITPLVGKDLTFNTGTHMYNIYDHDDAQTVASYVSTNNVMMLSMWNINVMDRGFSVAAPMPTWNDPGIIKQELDISRIHLCVETNTCQK